MESSLGMLTGIVRTVVIEVVVVDASAWVFPAEIARRKFCC